MTTLSWRDVQHPSDHERETRTVHPHPTDQERETRTAGAAADAGAAERSEFQVRLAELAGL